MNDARRLDQYKNRCEREISVSTIDRFTKHIQHEYDKLILNSLKP